MKLKHTSMQLENEEKNVSKLETYLLHDIFEKRLFLQIGFMNSGKYVAIAPVGSYPPRFTATSARLAATATSVTAALKPSPSLLPFPSDPVAGLVRYTGGVYLNCYW